MRRILVLAVALLGTASALPGSFLAPSTWIVLEIESVGTTEVRLWFDPSGPSAGVAMAYLSTGQWGGTKFWGSGGSLSIEHQGPEGNTAIHRRLPTEALSDLALGTGVVVADGQMATVLLGTFGAVEEASYTVNNPASSVSVFATGPTYATDGSDLEGGRWVELSAAGAHAHYAEERILPLDIEHALFGWFGAGPTPVYQSLDEATLTLPNSTVLQCPCELENLTPAGAHGPGEYIFAWQGIGASPNQHTPLVAWADVQLPHGPE